MTISARPRQILLFCGLTLTPCFAGSCYRTVDQTPDFGTGDGANANIVAGDSANADIVAEDSDNETEPYSSSEMDSDTAIDEQWNEVNSPVLSRLFTIWGSAEDDIWIVGEKGIILHWDGEVWAKSSSPTSLDLLGLWGSSSDDIWAVGALGTILHYNGIEWTVASNVPTTENLNRTWGISETDVWTVGDNGVALHFDGTDWKTFSTSNDYNYVYIWGTAGDNIWVADEGGSPFHWNGMEWESLHDTFTPSQECGGTFPFGTAEDDMWMHGIICGRAGCGATMSYWNGIEWKCDVGSGTAETALWAFKAVWNGNENEFWIAGGNISVWDRTQWIASLHDPSSSINGIWGSRSDNIWAVGDNGIILNRRARLSLSTKIRGGTGSSVSQ